MKTSYIRKNCSLGLILFVPFLAIAGDGPRYVDFSATKYSNERGAVRQLLQEEIKDAESLPNASKVTIRIALEDLNGDGRADILAYIDQYPYFCGTRGCRLLVLMTGKGGTKRQVLTDAISHDMIQISKKGMDGYRDIILSEGATWIWNGEKYIYKGQKSDNDSQQ